MNFTLLQSLNVLRAHYKVVLLMLLVALAGGLAVFLLVPKQYTATSVLVFDVRAPDPVSGQAIPVLGGFYTTTQVDVINSTRVARKVVAQLRLTDSPTAKQQWLAATDGQGKFETWAAEAIRKGLKPTASKDSNLVAVAYTSEDPNFAAAAANAFAQAYIEASIELKTDPARQFARWFDEQGKVARTNVERAQAKLSEFLQKHGIVTKDENLDAETAALRELTGQLTSVRSQTFDFQSKQRSADDTLPDVMQNPVVAALRSDIAQKEAKLQDAANNLGTNHPQYRRMEAELAELKNQLKQEAARVTKGFSSSTSAGRGREADLRVAIEAQRKKLLELKNLRDQLAVLQRDVDVAQAAYDSVGRRYNQSNLESQLTQTNVNVLNVAETPTKPSFPDPLKLSAATVLIGLALGCGLAFLLELFNRRVRSIEDITTMLELPVLVTIERLPRSRKPSRLLWWRRTALTSR